MSNLNNNNNNNVKQEHILEEFRDAWRQEVNEKYSHDKQQLQESFSNEQNALKHNKDEEESIADLVERTESLTSTEEVVPVTAMDHYVIAADNERQGKLGKALDSYRRAFKLDADIDYAYEKHYQNVILPNLQKNQDTPKNPTEAFKHIVLFGKEYTAPSAARKDPLANLIEQFSNEHDLSYIPKLDYKPVAIAKLPSEIMLNILRILILNSISTMPYFALTCKKNLLLSRDPSIWQYACIRVFREPSMTLEQSKRFQLDYVQKYGMHWMQMFIDRPRIRYDGVYISACHYIRAGASETGWDNKPIHFITYYRYIRFFPNGVVLKHVTTDEPQNVVNLLKRGFNKQQCFHGRFTLDEEDRITIVSKDTTMPRETFNLTLKIKTTHRGRHNKLNWVEYVSVSDMPNSGEHHHDLKPLKAFFFSPVRSYQVNYPDDNAYI